MSTGDEKRPMSPRPDHETKPFDALPLQSYLTYEWLSVTNLLNRQASNLLRSASDVKLTEWRCMTFIGHFGTIPLYQIHQFTEMDPGLITRTVQSLVLKQLVRTSKDPSDRRLVLASLTPEGEETFRRLRTIMHARQVALLAALTPRERSQIFKILAKLRGAATAGLP